LSTWMSDDHIVESSGMADQSGFSSSLSRQSVTELASPMAWSNAVRIGFTVL
jgi:hypothetical protein